MIASLANRLHFNANAKPDHCSCSSVACLITFQVLARLYSRFTLHQLPPGDKCKGFGKQSVWCVGLLVLDHFTSAAVGMKNTCDPSDGSDGAWTVTELCCLALASSG